MKKRTTKLAKKIYIRVSVVMFTLYLILVGWQILKKAFTEPNCYQSYTIESDGKPIYFEKPIWMCRN